MTERRQIHNDFEGVYLKFNSVKKYLKTARPEILQDHDYASAIKTVAGHFYNKNRAIFSISGFEFEDIHNLCQLFGIAFTGSKYEAKTKSDEIGIMVHFITQRLRHLRKWINRKFDTDEVVVGMDMDLHSHPIVEVETGLGDLEDDLDRVTHRIKVSRDKEVRSRLRHRQTLLHTQIQDIKAGARQLNKERTLQFMSNKKDMIANIDKHRETLCYYATVKFVSKDVRKYARLWCKKYGINYREWAKAKTQTGAENGVAFSY